MLWTLIITVVIITVAIYFGRRARHARELEAVKPSAENYRPLFEPTPAELRLASGAKPEVMPNEPEPEPALQEHAEIIAALSRWEADPSAATTAEVIKLAAGTENGDTYLEIAKKVVNAWRTGRLNALSADDLAQLLESHLWLLPAGERSSGVRFCLRDEIAGLHRGRE